MKTIKKSLSVLSNANMSIFHLLSKSIGHGWWGRWASLQLSGIQWCTVPTGHESCIPARLQPFLISIYQLWRSWIGLWPGGIEPEHHFPSIPTYTQQQEQRLQEVKWCWWWTTCTIIEIIDYMFSGSFLFIYFRYITLI